MIAAELADKLSQDVESVCKMLLPDGARQGNEYCVGSVSGESGDSLKVRLTGAKRGRWSDFASSADSGDLLDLWAKTKGIGITDAIRDAADYLGIDRKSARFEGREKKQYKKPGKPQGMRKPIELELNYLTDKRKLSVEAVNAYRIRSRDNEILFPHFRSAGENRLVAIKYRRIDSDRADKWRWEAGCEPILFGWQAIPEDAREVVICEGHLDAPSWWQLGHPALSIPNGVNAMDWIGLEYDALDRFDLIYLAMDNDSHGEEAISQIVDRLGRERIKVIRLPEGFKDANDLLQGLAPPEKVQRFFDQAETLDPEMLRKGDQYLDDVLRIARNEADDTYGYKLPWDKKNSHFRIRPGEVTLYAGVNFSGKSAAVNQIANDLMLQGVKTCGASLEYKPGKWIANLTRQMAAQPLRNLSIEDITEANNLATFNLWVFTAWGKQKFKEIMDVFAYARKRYGCWLFVIDNLQKLGLADDDYTGQVDVINALTDFAKQHDCHVILVHHMNKSNDQTKLRGINGVRGAGGLTDLVDNVIEHWRNHPKEDQIQAYQDKEESLDSNISGEPDAKIKVHKDKNGEGTPPLYEVFFDLESNMYKNGPFEKVEPKIGNQKIVEELFNVNA